MSGTKRTMKNQTNRKNSSTETIELTVALLISDLKEARELSLIFRKVGIIPHIYEDLRSYWSGSLEKNPSLSIVDVRLMNQGELLLKNHPHVQSENMPIAFFYSDETEPLLYSTYDIFHLGVIKSAPSFEGQVKAVLKRVNKMKRLEKDAHFIEAKNTAIDGQLVKLVEMSESLKEEDYYTKLLKSVCGRFDLQKNSEDFLSAIETVLTSLKEVNEFAALELSHNGQKLVSPKLYHSKFKDIPSLWLGKTCPNGIEFFAQNMASQVALDLMGGDLMSLLIRGVRGNPEKIIFIRTVDEDFLAKFDWESLERYLGGLYCYFELRDQGNFESTEKTLQPWGLFSILDQNMFGKLPEATEENNVDDSYSLIDVDFSDLVELIRSKRGMRFYWRKFYNDFFARFEVHSRIDFKISAMDPQHFAVLVAHEDAEKVFSDLKSFSLRYPYWRYFEDVDVVLARNMKPAIKMVPTSSEAYLRYLEDKSSIKDTKSISTAKTRAVKKKREVFWSPGPNETM